MVASPWTPVSVQWSILPCARHDEWISGRIPAPAPSLSQKSLCRIQPEHPYVMTQSILSVKFRYGTEIQTSFWVSEITKRRSWDFYLSHQNLIQCRLNHLGQMFGQHITSCFGHKIRAPSILSQHVIYMVKPCAWLLCPHGFITS